jgi:hypothetical protein
MKLEVSKLTLAWKYITSGFGGVADYLIDILNNALGNLDARYKDNIQAVLNFALKIHALMESLKWLCPTKWQTAYKATLDAVKETVNALSDFSVTNDEIKFVYGKFMTAVDSWKSDDDGTCLDSVE